MALIIQKFGGTSVGSIDRIQAVAHHISDTVKKGHQVVTVVSAMGSQTDDLLEMAYAINPTPPLREVDMLLTVGERITMSLLSMALNRLNIPSQSLTGSQSGILTDANHGNARIQQILGHRVAEGLQKGNVVIVAGFQGMSPESKEITTLGRGGSDLTALALAHSLKADQCIIFKDVDGICSADPRLVPNAKILAQLTWNQLLDLTWSGAGVLHARAAHLAKKYCIPLEIRSSFNLTRSGTRIAGGQPMEKPQLTALAHKDGQIYLKWAIRGKTSPMASVLSWLWQRGEAPIITHERWEDGRFVVEQVMSQSLLKDLTDFLAHYSSQNDGRFEVLAEDRNLATISVVGEGFCQSPETISAVQSALPMTPRFFEIKNTTIIIGLHESDLSSGLNALHQNLF